MPLPRRSSVRPFQAGQAPVKTPRGFRNVANHFENGQGMSASLSRLTPLLARAAAVVVLVLIAGACRPPSVRPAPFRVRPDSVEQGSLRGPFDGRVLDSSGGTPVAGAMVYATWSFQDGYGLGSPAGHAEVVTATDASGRYRIAELEDWPSGRRLISFTMLIYKRGYVAYRSDRRFSDFGPRRDFAQHNNEVVLERWRSEYSHARHLRYVGGGPAVTALTAWETDDAVAELSGQAEGPVVAADLVIGGGSVTASQIVTEDDLRSLTEFEGAFETGPLNDEADTRSYSSQHFRALGQPENFDIAVRLWKTSADEADERYQELLETLPELQTTDEIADRSFRAKEGDIFGVGFLDRGRGVVVLLTCGEGQCKSMDIAVAIGRKAHERLRERVPEGAGLKFDPGQIEDEQEPDGDEQEDTP